VDRVPSLLPPLPPSVRAGLLGFVTGLRSQVPVALLAVEAERGHFDPGTGRLARRFASREGVLGAVVAMGGELVADKLPATPSRLAAGPLGGRLVAGGTAAAAVARRDGHDPVLPALVGVAGALGGAVLGNRLRGVASRRFGSDRPGAFLEDGVAAALGWVGARRATA
jgi:uncharacterized membrane protein